MPKLRKSRVGRNLTELIVDPNLPKKSFQLRINGNILGMPPGLGPQILILFWLKAEMISDGVLRTSLFIAYLWPWLMLALQRTGKIRKHIHHKNPVRATKLLKYL